MIHANTYGSGAKFLGRQGNVWPGGGSVAAKKIFVNNDNVAAFTCLKCEKTNILDVFGYKSVNKPVKMICQCACGHTNSFFLERRRFRRRRANLPGVCAFGKEKIKRLIVVKDLSRGGLRLRLQSVPKIKPKIGDKVFLAFYLDDEQKTLLTQKAVVKNISMPYMGVEFCSRPLGNAFDKAVGNYMLY